MKTKTILTIMTICHIFIAALCGFLTIQPDALTQNQALFYFPVSVISALSACMFGLYSLRAESASKTRQ